MPSLFHAANLLDQLATGVVAVDRERLVRAVNTAAERLLCRPRRHMLGVSLERILPGHPVALDLLERAGQLGMVCRSRNARLNPAPEVEIAVSLTALPILDQHGNQAGALLQMEEVGAAERLEAGERLQETMVTLGTMALSVAHEVKNPLAGIRGAAQLLELDPHGPAAGECTALIRTEVDRVSRLLDTLLGLADSPPTREEEVNVHEVLDHVIKLCGREPPLPRRDYDPSLPPVRGDRDRLVQVFLNLVKNAREAVGAAGDVVLLTRVAPRIRMEQGRRYLDVMVEVRDNGGGIPAELRKQVFNPFFTTKPMGTGLGLAITRKIIHDHGGLVELDSQHGQTIFRVILPTQR